MGKNKPIIGFILGIIVAVVIFFANIPGLERTGQMCMAFSLMTVIFWAFGIAQPGYVSGLYLLLLAVFKVAPTTLIFSTWTTSMMYLIIGAYLIAVAVKESGLGERIAYKFIVKYVSSFKKYYRFYLCSDVHSGLIDSASLAARFSHYVGHGCCGKKRGHSP